MSDPMHPSQDHPDELLAGFVDGSATAPERRTVEAHLAGCPRCRHEIELATAARAALAALPELDAPGLAGGGIDGLRRADLQPVPAGAPAGPAPPRRRIAWAQLAAAAILVALVGGLVAIPLLLSGGGGSKQTTAPNAAPAPTAAASLPPLIDRGANYTQASLEALAGQLATAQKSGERAAAGAAPQPVYGRATATDASAVQAALTCIGRGGGPTSGAVPVYLEQAQVSGTPAYIGAFRLAATKLNLLLIAVSRAGCQPLYSVREPV
jgi:anti-sigma factor RsiW